jgi:uncharacterized protein YwgA
MQATFSREMQPGLAVLSVFLEELGVEPEITTVADRKRVQKAVYLGQRGGVDLGYRFSWYKKGPYSPMLTRDYYSLSEARDIGEHVNGARLAPDTARDLLQRVKSIFAVPKDLNLPQEDWLELLASYDYLRRVSKLSAAEAEAIVAREKRHLREFIPQAQAALASVGLLNE